MAPSKRLSSDGIRNSLNGAPQQRSISSFFLRHSSSPASSHEPCLLAAKSKPLLVVGPPTSSSDVSIGSVSTPLSAKRPRIENLAEGQPEATGHQGKRASQLPHSGCGEAHPSAISRTLKQLSQECKDNTDEPDISNFASVVGKRLRVYWPLDQVWYDGQVIGYQDAAGKYLHVIHYNDGDEETLDLSKEKIEWLPCAKPGRRRLRKLSSYNGSKTSPAGQCQEPRSPKRLFPECVTASPDDEKARLNEDDNRRSKRSCRKTVYSNDVECFGEEEHETDEEWTGVGKESEDKSDDSEEVSESGGELDGKLRKAKKTLRRKLSKGRSEKVSPETDECDNAKNHSAAPHSIGRSRKSVGKGSKSSKRCLEGFVVRQRERATTESFDQPNVSWTGMDDAAKVYLIGEAAERFGHRDAEKFKFLYKDRKDAAGRGLNDPNYDPRTLFLPKEFLKGISAGQRQWWEFKSKHMDKVLLFKMGKFYEMFEMDAHIGVQKLDLQYMKGDQPHCGFPEKNFEENAERLARLGYRVLVVEQTETPEQLEKRNMKSGTKDKVVKREICAVITKGTITEGDMLASTPDAAYLMAVFEIPKNDTADGVSIIGLCFVDAATSRFMIGQFLDDMGRCRLRSTLSELRPVELVKPCGMLTGATEKALKDQTRNPLVTILTPGLEFWDSKKTIDEILKLFCDRTEDKNEKENYGTDSKDRLHVLPEFLKCLVNAGGEGEAAICAFGCCVSYLRQVLLDRTLLGFGRFELLPGSDLFMQLPLGNGTISDKRINGRNVCSISNSTSYLEPHMVLDSSALENLDILENSNDSGTSGYTTKGWHLRRRWKLLKRSSIERSSLTATSREEEGLEERARASHTMKMRTLLGQLDHCVTAFGRRLLKQWIVRPLLRTESIIDRQNAVEDIKGVAADAAAKFRNDLSRLPDMERLVVRLGAWSEKSGRNAQGVVLYEDAAKKLLKDFISSLRGFQKIVQVLSLFTSIASQFSSNILRQLLTPGKGVPDLVPLLQHFEDAFDWSDAERTGRISPHKGIDQAFDSGSAAVSRVTGKLKEYLEEQQKYFGNQSDVTYVTVGKERYQIEVPESLQEKVPPEYEVGSQRKGFRRYSTPRVKEILQELVIGETKKETSLKNILQELVKCYCRNYDIWLHTVHVIAEMDALISLSEASKCIAGATCKPVISTNELSSADFTPFLFAKALRHPILESSLDGERAFVPNDVRLGGKGLAPFMLLTGPNMGGKSTLLRQVCLAIILAQIGARVAAEAFQISPVDRIFIRMGAKDHIMAGQSTFLVELQETASMLTSATRDSLVALDELGRGTATSDGQAIAHAVLEHLTHKIGCRGMFSTHYHHLADSHANDPTVALYHMACRVEASNGIEKVAFLYKLAPDACPKSYGVNVARIAGIPESVLKRAAACSGQIGSCKCIPRHRVAVGFYIEEKLFSEVLKSLRNMMSSDPSEMVLPEVVHQQWKKVSQLVAQ